MSEGGSGTKAATDCERSGFEMAVGLDISRFMLMRCEALDSTCPVPGEFRWEVELDRETDGVGWKGSFDKAERDKYNEELEADGVLL